MNYDLNNLIRLTKLDVKAAAGVLARAFQDYPLSKYFFPDESERRKKQPATFRMLIRHGLKYGEVYITSTRVEGVAVWFPYNRRYDTWWSNLMSGRFFMPFIVGMATEKRQRAFGEYTAAVRKRVVPFPYWYLQLLGVDPRYQGQGFSSRLLKPMFIRADKEGLPCYLETQSERNVELYGHLGFKVVDEGIVPGSNLKTWSMLRGKVV